MPAALSAIMAGVMLNLDNAENAASSAQALTKSINDPSIEVVVKSDELSAKHLLSIQRRHFGNLKISTIDADFVHGPDYQVLANAAATFKGLIGAGAMVRRGQGDKAKEFAIRDFHEAMNWLRDEAGTAAAARHA